MYFETYGFIHGTRMHVLLDDNHVLGFDRSKFHECVIHKCARMLVVCNLLLSGVSHSMNIRVDL